MHCYFRPLQGVLFCRIASLSVDIKATGSRGLVFVLDSTGAPRVVLVICRQFLVIALGLVSPQIDLISA
jgi:hypothetical protein